MSSTREAEEVFYHYDFNGNIVQITSRQQIPLASYTYSPFGEVLLKEGPFDSRYQFSTKEYDAHTAMNYYGYRFYNPELGRWINRDPLGELDSPSLYSFVLNDPLNHHDYLGLKCNLTGTWTKKPTWNDVKNSVRVKVVGCKGPSLDPLTEGDYPGVGIFGVTFEGSVSVSAEVNCKGCCDNESIDVNLSLDVFASVQWTTGVGLTWTMLWPACQANNVFNAAEGVEKYQKIKDAFQKAVDTADVALNTFCNNNAK